MFIVWNKKHRNMINEFNINIKINALEQSNSDHSNEILSSEMSKYNHKSNLEHKKLVYGKYLSSSRIAA